MAKYYCKRCMAHGIGGKGFSKHYKSSRCDDRLDAYERGYKQALHGMEKTLKKLKDA